MSQLEFQIDLIGSPKQYEQLLMNFINYKTYLSHQIKSIKILENNNQYTITEEELFFKSIKKTFVQQSKHYSMKNNTLTTEIISGPIEGSTINIILNGDSSKTHVTVIINFKIKLQFKIFSPLINQSYKTFIMAILLKMQNSVLNYE